MRVNIGDISDFYFKKNNLSKKSKKKKFYRTYADRHRSLSLIEMLRIN